MTSASDVKGALKVAVEKYGSVNAAVNCAGIGIAVKTLSKQGPHPLDEFQRVLTVNSVGTFNVIRLAAEIMATSDTLNASGERGKMASLKEQGCYCLHYISG